MSDNLKEAAWEEALSSLPDGGELLQSRLWGRVALASGRFLYNFSWTYKGELIVLAQVLESRRAGQKSWYLPRGPLCLRPNLAASVWSQVFADLCARAQKAGVIFLRFEPENWSLDSSVFGRMIKAVQPARSLFLNLLFSEEELLTQMHSKTRYNIRLAEKKGVRIEQGSKEDIPAFWSLLQATTARDSFRGHSLAHYYQLLSAGSPAIELWLAKSEDKVLAAGIFAFYQGRAVYLHGASADADRQYMAPYLLQWRMITRAKEKACRYYDFYGIDEDKWPGVTRFKRGFGGEERSYPGTFVTIINKNKYFIYSLTSYFLSFTRFLIKRFRSLFA